MSHPKEGMPHDPNQTEWVDKLSEWADIFPAYEKSPRPCVPGHDYIPDPNSGQGFGINLITLIAPS